MLTRIEQRRNSQDFPRFLGADNLLASRESLSEQCEKQFVRFPWEKDEECAKAYINIVDWKQFYTCITCIQRTVLETQNTNLSSLCFFHVFLLKNRFLFRNLT